MERHYNLSIYKLSGFFFEKGFIGQPSHQYNLQERLNNDHIKIPAFIIARAVWHNNSVDVKEEVEGADISNMFFVKFKKS